MLKLSPQITTSNNKYIQSTLPTNYLKRCKKIILSKNILLPQNRATRKTVGGTAPECDCDLLRDRFVHILFYILWWDVNVVRRYTNLSQLIFILHFALPRVLPCRMPRAPHLFITDYAIFTISLNTLT